MHELSIALSIIDLVEDEARRRALTKIRAVHLQLGVYSGVVKEALLSAFAIARQGSLLENANLIIQEVPIVLYCPTCACPSQASSPQHLSCCRCGTLSAELISGREMDLVGLEIEA